MSRTTTSQPNQVPDTHAPGRHALPLLRAVTGILALVIVAAVCVPMTDPRLPPAPVDGQAFWDLPTGSRVAYVHLPPTAAFLSGPLVFVHGGPGVADMRGDSQYFGQLTADGYDVYVYDGLGTGRSSRLDDPRGYTLERDVDDLVAIRQQIGGERLTLIGHSYGAVVAAAFLVRQPASVQQVVFSSPGGLASLESAGSGNLQNRLTREQRLGLYALLLWPRALLGYALLQVNPSAAHAFASDAEMDARYDRVYAAAEPALHCQSAPLGAELHGLGFYVSAIPRQPTPDLLRDLTGVSTRALVIKGECDYLTWTSAADYLRALPNARLVYLRGAGHNAYQDVPDQFLVDVRAFLRGSEPANATATDARPTRYQGLP
jgi:proline iminopeptidase